MRLHPASPALDYALYLKGVVNFNDQLGLFTNLLGQDLSERDPKQAKLAFEAFRELVSRFPESRYAEDARVRMQFIRNNLARSDVHVARYYFDQGAYVAAISRAQEAIETYRDVPAVEEALFILYRSYDRLGLTQLRDDTRRVLERSYPQSSLLYPERDPRQNARPWWKLW